MDCPNCSNQIEYSEVHCGRCGFFAGFPNRRAAEAERDELIRRHAAAQADAVARGVSRFEALIDEIAERSQPVIAMSVEVCDDILRSGKYRNYDQRIASGERKPAAAKFHSDREIVAARLFPAYGEHIVYACLSPDGKGLTSYGQVAVQWNVTPNYLGRRASLIEDNSFTFFTDHHLGALGAEIPAGYRATWEDRAKLAGAKLLPRVTATTPDSALEGMFMDATNARGTDEFFEIAIYAERGLDTQDVDMVTLLRPITLPKDQERWELIKASCAARTPSLTPVE